MLARLKRNVRDAEGRVVRAGRRAWRDVLGDRFPGLPRTINFLANDICNSRCEMCLIWERKRGKEVSPDELRKVLADPLYREVTYVGVSGGEPTLRADLPELYAAICETLPKLKAVGAITNAIQAEQVKGRVMASASVAKANGVRFGVMVSLDGVGEMHDRVRGYPGNFESAMAVIRHFRDETDLPLSIGCTVTKTNVWGVDDVLDLCRREEVKGRFRVAEFIDRLYNAGQGAVIRNFDPEERYQLALFFKKLEVSYETQGAIRETYRNIRRMLIDRVPRESGCPYQTEAVCLDSRAELAYCAPKSPKIGSALDASSDTLFRTHLPVRRRIVREQCPGCIHDYHAPPTDAAHVRMAAERRARAALSVARALKRAARVESAAPGPPGRLGSALVVGWYGTETAGDKAILWDVVRRLRERDPAVAVTVASLHPFVTRWTLGELGLDGIDVVETYSQAFIDRCRAVDAVVMGGGPLMGMEPLGFVLSAFVEARRAGAWTAVDGCGIGPLRREEHVRAVREILRLANVVTVRDTPSLAWATREAGREDAACAGDPAVGYVRAWRAENPTPEGLGGPAYLACFLRHLSYEYADGARAAEFDAFRERFEEGLAGLIAEVAGRTGLTPLLLPMHTFTVGGDDRDFARRFARMLPVGLKCEVADRVYAPGALLAAMASSPFSICMRFHSVLFAETLGVPYLAVDYTGGGKIRGLLADRGREDVRLDRDDLAEGRWQEALAAALPASLVGGR